MRGGGGKYDNYLVYFDDVAKLKATTKAGWHNYMSESISDKYSSRLVGVLFYNPTDHKFYFFGYDKFFVSPVCESGSVKLSPSSPVRKSTDKLKDDINSEYTEMIRVNLVKSLLPCINTNTSVQWRKKLNWDIKDHVPPPSTSELSKFNCYLTYSNGELKYTEYRRELGWSNDDYISTSIYTCTDNRQLRLPSRPISLLTEAPTTTTENSEKTIKCTNTKRALLFYKLPDKYQKKDEYDPTPGLFKTDSKPSNTAYRLISDLIHDFPAQSSDDSSTLPDSTPVLEFTWLDPFPLKKEPLNPDL
jgi:hypothetical protein